MTQHSEDLSSTNELRQITADRDRAIHLLLGALEQAHEENPGVLDSLGYAGRAFREWQVLERRYERAIGYQR